MLKYEINSNGRSYILNPLRNEDRRIPTSYFKNVIIIYIFEKGKYKPSEFKDYMKSLGILNDKDWESMTTRNYPIWKHHIDAAKQGLLGNQVLAENQDGTFSILDKKSNDAYNKISNYIEVVEQLEPEFLEQEEYPPEKVTTTVTRRIRDTPLSNELKEERNYQCQVCGTTLTVRGRGYAETHHVKPLGHEGPDTETNMLVLCPNHHVLFDYGEIAISPKDCETVIGKEGNEIFPLIPPAPKKEYIDYHYNKIYKR